MRPTLWEDQFDLVFEDSGVFMIHEQNQRRRQRTAQRTRLRK